MAEPTPEAKKELSASEKRAYGQLGEMMELYHNHFRHTWNQLYTSCSGSQNPNSLTASRLVSTGLSFLSQLTMHHNIEETYVFPQLGKRMPGFAADGFAKSQHAEIHAGMDRLESYLLACKSGEREMRRDEVKEIMDGFGTVLWRHLDEEVRELGAENMSRYWSVEEVKMLGF